MSIIDLIGDELEHEPKRNCALSSCMDRLATIHLVHRSTVSRCIHNVANVGILMQVQGTSRILFMITMTVNNWQRKYSFNMKEIMSIINLLGDQLEHNTTSHCTLSSTVQVVIDCTQLISDRIIAGPVWHQYS